MKKTAIAFLLILMASLIQADKKYRASIFIKNGVGLEKSAFLIAQAIKKEICQDPQVIFCDNYKEHMGELRRLEIISLLENKEMNVAYLNDIILDLDDQMIKLMPYELAVYLSIDNAMTHDNKLTINVRLINQLGNDVLPPIRILSKTPVNLAEANQLVEEIYAREIVKEVAKGLRKWKEQRDLCLLYLIDFEDSDINRISKSVKGELKNIGPKENRIRCLILKPEENPVLQLPEADIYKYRQNYVIFRHKDKSTLILGYIIGIISCMAVLIGTAHHLSQKTKKKKRST